MVALPPVLPTPASLRALRALTRRIPPLPHASGISNRVVKPLWCRWHAGRFQLEIWDGVQMIVDPADSMGGNLAFIPQLVDHWERKMIRQLLPEGGTFVDIGANIGSYSLWAARRVGRSGAVVAFEAEPRNFAALLQNISINDYPQIRPFQVGVSDKVETLSLRLNPSGNAGGHSFLESVHAGQSPETVDVRCEPLSSLLGAAGVDHVDWMKLDIEGFEGRVLDRFFQDTPRSSPLRPRHILTEFFSGDDDGSSALERLITSAGYAVLHHERGSGHNVLFERSHRGASA